MSSPNRGIYSYPLRVRLKCSGEEWPWSYTSSCSDNRRRSQGRCGATARSTGRSKAQSKDRITVPAGTRILIRTVDSIDSSKQKAGFRFTATLETNLQAEDSVVARRGTTVYGRLAQASSAGRMKGSSELTLELTDIVINGTAYPLLTSTYEVKGKGEGGNTAKKVVGGAGLGALIGGLAGGRKGGRNRRSGWCSRRNCHSDVQERRAAANSK